VDGTYAPSPERHPQASAKAREIGLRAERNATRSNFNLFTTSNLS
jgi:hypothetical protein